MGRLNVKHVASPHRILIILGTVGNRGGASRLAKRYWLSLVECRSGFPVRVEVRKPMSAGALVPSLPGSESSAGCREKTSRLPVEFWGVSSLFAAESSARGTPVDSHCSQASWLNADGIVPSTSGVPAPSWLGVSVEKYIENYVCWVP